MYFYVCIKIFGFFYKSKNFCDQFDELKQDMINSQPTNSQWLEYFQNSITLLKFIIGSREICQLENAIYMFI